MAQLNADMLRLDADQQQLVAKVEASRLVLDTQQKLLMWAGMFLILTLIIIIARPLLTT